MCWQKINNNNKYPQVADSGMHVWGGGDWAETRINKFIK